jgi:ketosteroid isomerase-like protein
MLHSQPQIGLRENLKVCVLLRPLYSEYTAKTSMHGLQIKLKPDSSCVKMERMTDFEKLQQENVNLARHLYEAFARQDIPALLQVLSDDIDWLFYGPTDIPFAGHYHGHEGVTRFFEKALDTTEFLRFEPREFLPGAHSVLVQGYERGRVKATDRTWETEWAHVFTVRNGKLTKLREYYDTAVVAAAFRNDYPTINT